MRAARGVPASPPAAGGNAGDAGSSPACGHPRPRGSSCPFPPQPAPGLPAKDTPQARPRHQDAFIGAQCPASPRGHSRSLGTPTPLGTPASPRDTHSRGDPHSPGQPHGGCNGPVGPGVPHSTPPPRCPHPPAGEGPGTLAGRGDGWHGHPGVRVASASCIFWRQRA